MNSKDYIENMTFQEKINYLWMKACNNKSIDLIYDPIPCIVNDLKESKMNFEELQKLILKWAEDRSIFEVSDPSQQYRKLYEEYCELGEGLVEKDRNKIIDSIGDMMVVQTIIAKMIGVDLTQCYASAYLQIRNRKGKMVDGLFVKEE